MSGGLGTHKATTGRRLSLQRVAAYVGISVGVMVFMLVPAFFIFGDAAIDRFLKSKIESALAEAYPAYEVRIARVHYNLWQNVLQCDSLLLMTADSARLCRIDVISARGINRMQLLRGGGLGPAALMSTVVDVNGIALYLPHSEYDIHCGRVHVSVPDSQLVVEAFELKALVNDELFFAGSKFGKTRFRHVIPQCIVSGLSCLDLLEGKSYRARSVHFVDGILDVLVLMGKPLMANSPSPQMPDEVLSSIQEVLDVDSLIVTNGRLKYGERYGESPKPAVLTFDDLQLVASGINNRIDTASAIAIRAKGNFMKNSRMDIVMSIPVAPKNLSFQYSGSLSPLNLPELNTFLENAEHQRIKSGILHSAVFDIHVIAGNAGGSLRAIYEDLSIAAIDGNNGSENGVGDRLASFLANNVKLHTTNMPDKSGSIKIGEVKYQRKRDDTFLSFAWFSLRSGLGSVVGF